GWDFSAAAELGPRSGDNAGLVSGQALVASNDVERLARYERAQLAIGSGDVDIFAFTPVRGSIEPTVVRGRMPAGPNEVTAGRATLRRRGKQIGDQLEVVGDRTVTLTVGGAASFLFLAS